jgi:hypothetical protein
MKSKIWEDYTDLEDLNLKDAMRWKGQTVPRLLIADLIADMEQRGNGKIVGKIVTEMGIDMPGMMMIDRGYQHIKLDTLDISIPYSDFTSFTSQLSGLKKRMFASGKEYYKLHGWLQAIVLTTAQRDLLLREMVDRAPAVEKLAEDEHVEFMRRLGQINKDGTKVVSHRAL